MASRSYIHASIRARKSMHEESKQAAIDLIEVIHDDAQKTGPAMMP
jgi:hypothetical protein